jgi:hypothetical protein
MPSLRALGGRQPLVEPRQLGEAIAPSRIRHCQVPLSVPGRFMRASDPSPSTSCTGTMARFATEDMTQRIIFQWTSRASSAPT